MARSMKEVRRDELLSRLTQEVIDKARRASVEIDGFDGSDGQLLRV